MTIGMAWMNNNTVPIWLKLNLTPKEASEYSNIGVSRIYEMLDDDCTFLLKIGNKKLIKRKEFEDFISRAQNL